MLDQSEHRDSYNLQRFVDAQQPVLQSALEELRAGRKRGHWMWFIFPQIKGLGSSFLASQFAITSIREAEEYLKHPLLGTRLIECTRLVVKVTGISIEEIFGFPDWLKFRSSMTLFAQVKNADPAFSAALAKYFGGQQDQKTLDLLTSL